MIRSVEQNPTGGRTAPPTIPDVIVEKILSTLASYAIACPRTHGLFIIKKCSKPVDINIFLGYIDFIVTQQEICDEVEEA